MREFSRTRVASTVIVCRALRSQMSTVTVVDPTTELQVASYPDTA